MNRRRRAKHEYLREPRGPSLRIYDCNRLISLAQKGIRGCDSVGVDVPVAVVPRAADTPPIYFGLWADDGTFATSNSHSVGELAAVRWFRGDRGGTVTASTAGINE